MKTILLLILISLSIAGCCSGRTTNQVFIRDTTYIKVPEIIQGSGTPQIVTDTIIQYSEVNGIDTIIKISYLPSKNLIKYVIKPDTVYFQVRDTLYNSTIERINVETPFLAKLGIFLAGIAIALIAFALYQQRNKLI